MTKAPTLREFQDRFPTEESCLEHLFQTRFGADTECAKCGREPRYTRVVSRRSYQCQWCAHQVYPTAGTPFDRTRTPLRDWFLVMFQFCTSRNGVAAKEVERQLGVTYKTAWRMCHQIREYMGLVDGGGPIGGMGRNVEIDETLIGGSVSGKGSGYKGNKTTVVGMVERGGRIVTHITTSRRIEPLRDIIVANVLTGSKISTDEFASYRHIAHSGYRHHTVNHKSGEYVGKFGTTTNAL